MTERAAAERMVSDLHMARLAGDLAGMCRLFADQGRFEIAGASADKPMEDGGLAVVVAGDNGAKR